MSIGRRGRPSSVPVIIAMALRFGVVVAFALGGFAFFPYASVVLPPWIESVWVKDTRMMVVAPRVAA